MMGNDTIATVLAIVLSAFTVGGFIMLQIRSLDSRVSRLETRFDTRMADFGEPLARIEGLLEGHFSRGRTEQE